MGTPAFMSPEQMRGLGAGVDGRSDLWSVGALMFALLSGHHVHERDSQVDVMVAAASQPARPVAELVSLPVEVERIVDRALAFAPEDRFQDARSMQRAVRHALATVRSARGAALDALGYAPTHAEDSSGPPAQSVVEVPVLPPVGVASVLPSVAVAAVLPSVAVAAVLPSVADARAPSRGTPVTGRSRAVRQPPSGWTLAVAGGGAAFATVAKAALLAALLLQVGAACRTASAALPQRSLVAAR